MNMLGHRLSLRHLFALASLALATAAFAGCTVSSSPDDLDEDDVSAAPQVGGGCCQEGTFICSSPVSDWDYGCGGMLKTTAANACKAACGGVACHDSGWHTFCF